MKQNGQPLPPQAVPAICVIQVALVPAPGFPLGQVQFSCQGGVSRQVVNMMLESARQLIIKEIEAQESGAKQAPAIELAPPGTRFQ